MIKLIAILVIILILVSGCGKEKTSTDQTIYLNKEYQSLKFKEQSYWVFQKDSLNIIDSLVVSKTDSGFYWNPPRVHGQAGTKREFYKMTIESKTNNYEYIDVIDSYGLRRNPETEWYICGRTFFSINKLSNFEYLDSLIVNGRLFCQVIKCKILSNAYVEGCTNSGFLIDTDLYTAKDFGIIRKVYYRNIGIETWNLIRWKIIK